MIECETDIALAQEGRQTAVHGAELETAGSTAEIYIVSN